MTQGIKQFLYKLGLLKHYDMFITKGFDQETDLRFVTERDLEEFMMISCKRERNIFLMNAKSFKPSNEHSMYQWLCHNFLDHYFISFVQSEITDLEAISKLELPNEDLYDELEIVLPGHRKRLERAVAKLKKDRSMNLEAEQPVQLGWWGKPECLPQAKFDFLCVKASLFSRNHPYKKVFVDFMVDSGSDVCTVQESTLKNLDLELIGPIYSCGIHGGNHTNLYKARLGIGDQEMDIEVMGSNYDSLGSRVIRHFRHIVDGHRHFWLKGNYKDPLPSILPLRKPALTTSNTSVKVPSDQRLLVPILDSSPHKNNSSDTAVSDVPTHESVQVNEANKKSGFQDESINNTVNSNNNIKNSPHKRGSRDSAATQLDYMPQDASSVRATNTMSENISRPDTPESIRKEEQRTDGKRRSAVPPHNSSEASTKGSEGNGQFASFSDEKIGYSESQLAATDERGKAKQITPVSTELEVSREIPLSSTDAEFCNNTSSEFSTPIQTFVGGEGNLHLSLSSTLPTSSSLSNFCFDAFNKKTQHREKSSDPLGVNITSLSPISGSHKDTIKNNGVYDRNDSTAKQMIMKDTDDDIDALKAQVKTLESVDCTSDSKDLSDIVHIQGLSDETDDEGTESSIAVTMPDIISHSHIQSTHKFIPSVPNQEIMFIPLSDLDTGDVEKNSNSTSSVSVMGKRKLEDSSSWLWNSKRSRPDEL